MQFENADHARIIGTDWATQERQSTLRTLHRAKLPPRTAESSGWSNDMAGRDRRSVRAWLRGHGDLRAAWWGLYSRVFLAVVPDADLERAMYSFHRRHHALTLSWLGYLAAVRQMRVDIQEKGVLAALKTLSKTDNYIGETLR